MGYLSLTFYRTPLLTRGAILAPVPQVIAPYLIFSEWPRVNARTILRGTQMDTSFLMDLWDLIFSPFGGTLAFLVVWYGTPPLQPGPAFSYARSLTVVSR